MYKAARRVATWIIKAEPLLLLFAVPVLVLPPAYLWKAQRGLNAYDALGDPSLAWPGPLSYLALALLALPWLARAVRDGSPLRPTPLDGPIALYLATMAMGLWLSTDRAHSLNTLLGIEGGVALYYGVWHWATEEKRELEPKRNRKQETRTWLLVGLLITAGAALAVLGFMQTDWALAQKKGAAFLAPLHDHLAGLPKLGAKRLNGSVVAGTLIIVIPLAVTLLAASRGERRTRPGTERWLAPVALILAVALMLGYVLTVWSRGDLLALAATAVLASLSRYQRGRETLLGLGLGAAAAGLGLLIFSPGTLMALGDRIHPGRAEVWTRALYIIGDHLFTGAGLDNFRVIARNSYPYFNATFDQSEHAHSWPLQAGVDGGLLGVVAVLWLALAFYNALRTKARSESRRESRRIRNLPFGFLAGFTAFLIGHLWDSGTMSGPRGALLVWTFLGATMAVTRGKRPRVRDKRPAQRNWKRLAAGAAILLAVVLIWNGRWIAGTFYNNMACVYRNQGLYTPELSDEERATRAAQALVVYRQALGAAPNLAPVHRNLGVLYYQAATAEETARHISWTIGFDFEPSAFFGGIEPPATGYLPSAMDHLEKAVHLAPGDVIARYYLEEAQEANNK
jgi:tetratricopeptide (TPR) repeat protein